MNRIKNLLRWIIVVLQFLPKHLSFEEGTNVERGLGLQTLQNACLDTFHNPEWWIYMWCYKRDISQYHPKSATEPQILNIIGTFSASESGELHHIYRSDKAECQGSDGVLRKRYGEVEIKCCSEEAFMQHERHQKERDNKLQSFISVVDEKETCSYYITVCSKHVCKENDVDHSDVVSSDNQAFLNSKQIPIWRRSDPDFAPSKINALEQTEALNRVRKMFYFAYNAYLNSAFPEGELKPISCQGGAFEPIKIPLVSLIDTLDTLAVMGEFADFRHAVNLVNRELPNFDFNANVSVFETTIRILGGLLSAHMLAADESLGIYDFRERQVEEYCNSSSCIHVEDAVHFAPVDSCDLTIQFPGSGCRLQTKANFDNITDACSAGSSDSYNNSLLFLALDLGERLLPAFNTTTGIPYGTVNLRHGVPVGETTIASTAGAGSLMIEFEVLSRLTGDRRFGDAAHKATKGLFDRRSTIGLVGKHINAHTGQWFESVSGIGSNSDSFYEYLLKSHLLFNRPDYFDMFSETYLAIKKHVQDGNWFGDVDMLTGRSRKNRVESLHGFWPGMETSIGLSESSTQLLNSLYAIWSDLGFLPEEIDQSQWLAGREVVANSFYPLRPELIESTYHHYRATGDRTWLNAGIMFLESLESQTRTECGYAAVENILTHKLSDVMPSFFLSETCKYLYLLFDENNFVHDRGYIFSTEAHLFHPLHLPNEDGELDLAGETRLVLSAQPTNGLSDFVHKPPELPHASSSALLQTAMASGISPTVMDSFHGKRCRKRIWWDGHVGYDSEYISPQSPRRRLSARRRNELIALRDSRTSASGVAAHSMNKIAGIVREIEKSNGDLYLPAAELYRDELIGTAYVEEQVKRRNICLPQDEQSAAEKSDGAIQVIEMNFEEIGEFTVRVLTNGFDIKSKQFGDSLEILNVGQELVQGTYSYRLARDEWISPPQLKTISGTQEGMVSTCAVRLVDSGGTPVNVSIQIGFGTKSATWVGPWEKPCTTAMFGTQDSFSIRGLVTNPPASDPELCKGKSSKRKSSTARAFGLSWTTDELDGQSASGQSPRVVVVDRGSCMFEDKTFAAQNAGAVGVIVANNEENIFMMSGKKAKEVVLPGALPTNAWQQLTQTLTNSLLGVVSKESVSNTEVKNEVKEILPPVADLDDDPAAIEELESSKVIPSPISASMGNVKRPVMEALEAMQKLFRGKIIHATQTKELSTDRVWIPTVMLTKSDAKQLRDLTLEPQQVNSEFGDTTKNQLFVQMERSIVPMVLDSSFLGYSNMPKLRTSSDSAVFLLPGRWSAVVSTTTGVEWQLYIIRRDEAVRPRFSQHPVVTRRRQLLSSTPPYLYNNDVGKYALFLGQRCPAFLRFDGKTLFVDSRRR